ncbi:hypothetical protein EPUS_05057 [Endocarpon pusillum Z07020]|uniref:SPIN90/Ldb17 leucine-rich domain-containing protein n=1 Tax=Endocarpon pusillum (strain Z07020 / HMAS-L-300199) TaxID=1263415 RepID=U1GM42_ENDPU|nr:uncharacterized protein EPUS_05057 [Endocarpon pusillum Z07020]ERF72976.1 hypothetical protein EPUS_05057 [Endocarpon pusillum Z07020]
MDLEVSYDFEDAEQVWNELDEIVSRECPSQDLIDDALRSFLTVATSSREKYISSEHDIARCSYILLSSPLFEKHEDYVRRQIVHCLLQDDEPDALLFVTSFLLFEIRETESTAELLNREGAFTRLLDLISNPKQNADATLHRMLMELLYEMSRIQRIRPEELVHVDDAFVRQLFALIEELSNDVNDPYHYPIIRVLVGSPSRKSLKEMLNNVQLVLNEQFMVTAHEPSPSGMSPVPLTNKVMKALATQGSSFKTFGENIILLLNRESETSLQLLTLKLLYLIFTTPSTQEYFYTNDLHVLVDILIRNLLDLPSDAAALRHTYLRVLYPLLAHTQLKHPPYYKYEEIRKLLAVLAGAQAIHDCGEDDLGSGVWSHFEEADETTKRLVSRCRTVSWLENPETTESEIQAALNSGTATSPVDVVSGEKEPPVPPIPRKLRKRNASRTASGYLIPQLDSARESALSVLEVAAQREKPGVMTPSRKASLRGAASKKQKPLPPRTRRSTWGRRARDVEHSTEEHSTSDVTASTRTEDQKQSGPPPEVSTAILFSPKDEHYSPPLTKQPPPQAPKSRLLHNLPP